MMVLIMMIMMMKRMIALTTEGYVQAKGTPIAGKGQASTLEQQKLTARGRGGSCREGFGGF